MTGVFAHWPNRITAMRFVGAFVLFGVFAVHAERPPADWQSTIAVAFWLFVTIASTDFLDGWLARRGKHVTAFGRIADPFVDKILIVGTMIFLAVMPWSRAYLPAWMVVVIVAREFLVTAIRGYVESEGHEFPADWFGKIKMVVQCVAIAAVLLTYSYEWSPSMGHFWSQLTHVSVWATLVSSVGSGVSYVLKTRTILSGQA